MSFWRSFLIGLTIFMPVIPNRGSLPTGKLKVVIHWAIA